jgi:hypothetical protein
MKTRHALIAILAFVGVALAVYVVALPRNHTYTVEVRLNGIDRADNVHVQFDDGSWQSSFGIVTEGSGYYSDGMPDLPDSLSMSWNISGGETQFSHYSLRGVRKGKRLHDSKLIIRLGKDGIVDVQLVERRCISLEGRPVEFEPGL